MLLLYCTALYCKVFRFSCLSPVSHVVCLPIILQMKDPGRALDYAKHVIRLGKRKNKVALFAWKVTVFITYV